MKRSALFLYAIVGMLCAVATAQAADVQNPMIVYRNDGQFNAFSTNDVDSITFSNISVDSVACSSVVTQIFWSGGVPFAVPVEATDSVAFTAPANRLQSGVTELSGELLAHLLRCEDDYNLIFDTSLPKNLIPRTGDRLVTLDMTEKLPIGFIGEVNAVESTTDHIRVTCDEIGLSDVYETFFGSFNGNISNNGKDETSVDSEENLSPMAANRAISTTYDRTLNLPTFYREYPFKSSWDVAEVLEIGSESKFSFSVSPKLRIRSFILVESPFKMSSSTMVVADFTVNEKFAQSFSGSIEKRFPLIKKSVPIAAAPALKLFVDLGLALKVDGEFGADVSLTQQFRVVGHASVSNGNSDDNISPSLDFKWIDASVDEVKAAGKASLSVGTYGQIGVAALCKDLANINVDVDAGWRFSINAETDVRDIVDSHKSTAFYESMSRHDAFKIDYYRDITLNASAFADKLNKSIDLHNLTIPLIQKSLLPRFSNVTAARREDRMAVEASARCTPGIIAAEPGFVAIKKSKNNVIDGTWVSPTKGNKNGDIVSASMSYVPFGNEYEIYPTLRAFNHDILASSDCSVDSIDTSIFEAKILDSFFLVDSKYEGKDRFLNWSLNYTAHKEEFYTDNYKLKVEANITPVDTTGMNLGYNVEFGYFSTTYWFDNQKDFDEFIKGEKTYYDFSSTWLPHADDDDTMYAFHPLAHDLSYSGPIEFVCDNMLTDSDTGLRLMAGVVGVYVKGEHGNRIKLSNQPFYIKINKREQSRISNPSYTAWGKYGFKISYDVNTDPYGRYLGYGIRADLGNVKDNRFSSYKDYLWEFDVYFSSSSFTRRTEYDEDGKIAYSFNSKLRYIVESQNEFNHFGTVYIYDGVLISNSYLLSNSLLWVNRRFRLLDAEPFYYENGQYGYRYIDL